MQGVRRSILGVAMDLREIVDASCDDVNGTYALCVLPGLRTLPASPAHKSRPCSSPAKELIYKKSRPLQGRQEIRSVMC